MIATVWTRELPCAPCARAKEALAMDGYGVGEIKVGRDATRDDFHRRFGPRATFPQVIVDGCHIGGWGNLRAYLGAAK